MSKIAINFFTEDLAYTLKHKIRIRKWLNEVIQQEDHQLEELNFILCSDEYLLRINQQYLAHDTYTDVITFDHSEALKMIAGDIFISFDRIKDNAKEFGSSVLQELYRVMVHGTLHLLGYQDKSKLSKRKMTEKEDHFLSLLKTI